MAIPFLNHLDLRSVSELQNAILHKTTESSASNVEGKIIYDTGTNTLKYRSDSAWISLSGQDANTFRTVKVDTTDDGTANVTLGTSENLELFGGTNITLAENAGQITINAGAATTVSINGGSERDGPITLQPALNTTSTQTIAVTEPNAAGTFHFDVVGGSIGTTELEDAGVTFAKIQNVATDTIVGRTASGTGVTKALSKSEVLGILNVADGAQANVATNLGSTTATGQIIITSSTGNNVTIGEATGSIAGVMSTDHHDKLDGIEAGATADQTNAEIRAAVEAASDSNVFTDADHTKLNGIAASANNYSASKTDLISVGATLTGDDTLVLGDSGEDTQVTIKGDLTVTGTQTVNNVVTVSTSNGVQFEGAAADGHDAVLKSVVASSSKTYTLPNITGHIPILSNDPGTTAISATPAELNLLDGDATVGTTAIVGGDGFIHNDGGTMRMTSLNKLAEKFAGTNINASGVVLSVPNGSTTTKGVVEVATTTEASTGTDNSRAVTPAGVKQFDDDRKHVSAVTSAIAAGATHTITHGLGTRDIIVQIFAMVTDLTTSGTDIVDQYAEIKLDVIRSTVNAITFTPNIAIRAISGTGSLRVLIKAL
tara:strand:- start:49 stop:1854 length:1806 start_codon:yes stop_codon:yes gene_type:complete